MKELKLGDTVQTCTCFFKGNYSHPTEIDCEDFCIYCGYFSPRERVTVDFLKRHNRRKSHYDTRKHQVFQDRMNCIISGKEYYDIVNAMEEDNGED